MAVSAVWGQGGVLPPDRVYPRFAQIQEYLGLTNVQMGKLLEQIDAFGRWSGERNRRMFQVQFEILEETARSPLDPVALGLRYAEVESIRREIADRSTKLIAENLAVLTDVQRVKLKALEAALQLVSTGSEAQAISLLPGCQSATFLLGGLPIGGIYDPVPVVSPVSFCGARTGFYSVVP